MRAIFHLILGMALLPLATPSRATAQEAADPTLYVVSYIEVVPAMKDATATLLRQLAEASRKDAGSLRFDVVQQKARTNHFKMIEVWKDQASDDAHEIAAHTKAFRDAL